LWGALGRFDERRALGEEEKKTEAGGKLKDKLSSLHPKPSCEQLRVLRVFI